MREQFARTLIIVTTLIFFSTTMSGSSCNTRAALSTIRSIHTDVRAGFVVLDNVVAPLVENAWDDCIERTEAQGLTGEDGLAAARECMGQWNDLRIAINAAHDILAELEEVYRDIENGREALWRNLALRLLTHAQNIYTICRSLEIEIPAEFIRGVDSLSSIRED